jgi:hypothetical protein
MPSIQHLPRELLTTKFGIARKTGLSNLGNRSIWFWQFQNRIKEEAKHEDLKIQLCFKHGKGKENIKESIHVLTTKFDILEKSECLICQIRTSGFYSDKMINISKWRPTLYISQVGPCRYVFQVMHMFLRKFG